jgi:hypothetical protein
VVKILIISNTIKGELDMAKIKSWYKTWWGIPVIGVSLILIIILFSVLNKDCSCPENELNESITSCPDLNCSTCPVKIQTKIETKTIIEKIYVCSDLTEVTNVDDCKTEEQKEIAASNYNLAITINKARIARSIGEYSLENLKSDEQFIIVDFSIYNKELTNGFEFNPNLILLEDSEGYSYSYSWDSSQLSKYWGGMTGVTVEYNTKKSGELAFVVPKSEKEFTLIVKSFTGTEGKKQFNIN